MKKEIKQMLALWLRDNRDNKHKINLVEYMQEQICKYAIQENVPAEQIKGMNKLLRDVITLDARMFESE